MYIQVLLLLSVFGQFMLTGHRLRLDYAVTIDDFRRLLPVRVNKYLTDEDIAGILNRMADWIQSHEDVDWEYMIWSLRRAGEANNEN
jgi:hypothetical protein